MTLIFDEYNDTFLWVDTRNYDEALSPEFDTEHDALVWQNKMKEYFIPKNKTKKDNELV